MPRRRNNIPERLIDNIPRYNTRRTNPTTDTIMWRRLMPRNTSGRLNPQYSNNELLTLRQNILDRYNRNRNIVPTIHMLRLIHPRNIYLCPHYNLYPDYHSHILNCPIATFASYNLLALNDIPISYTIALADLTNVSVVNLNREYIRQYDPSNTQTQRQMINNIRELNERDNDIDVYIDEEDNEYENQLYEQYQWVGNEEEGYVSPNELLPYDELEDPETIDINVIDQRNCEVCDEYKQLLKCEGCSYILCNNCRDQLISHKKRSCPNCKRHLNLFIKDNLYYNIKIKPDYITKPKTKIPKEYAEDIEYIDLINKSNITSINSEYEDEEELIKHIEKISREEHYKRQRDNNEVNNIDPFYNPQQDPFYNKKRQRNWSDSDSDSYKNNNIIKKSKLTFPSTNLLTPIQSPIFTPQPSPKPQEEPLVEEEEEDKELTPEEIRQLRLKKFK